MLLCQVVYMLLSSMSVSGDTPHHHLCVWFFQRGWVCNYFNCCSYQSPESCKDHTSFCQPFPLYSNMRAGKILIVKLTEL